MESYRVSISKGVFMFHFPIKKQLNSNYIYQFSMFLVYIGIALLAISDSGIQLLILMEIGPGSRTLRLIAMWLLFIKILLTRYSKKEFLLLTPVTLLALYNYTVSGNIYCVYTVLVIACLKDVDFSTLFKVLFYSTLSAVVFVGILSFFNIGSPTQLTQDFGRGLVETRYCFGLYHPNIWHQAIGRCIIFACIGYFKQLNIIHLLILLVFNYFIYTMSVSRTGLLAVSIFLILLIFYKYLKKFMHTLFVKICAIAGMFGVYSLYIYYTYKLTGEYHLRAEEFNWIIATGRLRQALNFLETHPIQMFSSRFPDDGTLFDCGFFRIFYECGYLWAIIFFAALFTLVILAMKKNWDIIIPVVVYFIFCSLYEFDPVTRPTYNIAVFFFALLVFPSLRPKFDDFMTSSRRIKSRKS